MKQLLPIIAVSALLLSIISCQEDETEGIGVKADFDASKLSIPEGKPVTFTDLSEGDPTQWSWTFEGGTPPTSNEQNPTITFAQEGVFNVSLTITNESSNSTESKTDFIRVFPPINVDFAADEVKVVEGSQIQFTDLSTGNPTSWEWTFVGGTPETSSDQNPIVTFNTTGQFDITLAASNSDTINTLIKTSYVNVVPDLDLTDGLVAHYPFDGNANDVSTYANDGMAFGPTLIADRNGVANNAYLFDGVDDYIIVPHKDQINFIEDQAFSISFWARIKPGDQVDQTFQGNAIISKWLNAEVEGEFVHGGYQVMLYNETYISSDFWNKIVFESISNPNMICPIDSEAINNCSSIDFEVADDQWRHFVMSRSVDDSAFFYIDGELKCTQKRQPKCDPSNEHPLLIGAYQLSGNGNGSFKGELDEIRLYNKVLTAEEVMGIYDLN